MKHENLRTSRVGVQVCHIHISLRVLSNGFCSSAIQFIVSAQVWMRRRRCDPTERGQKVIMMANKNAVMFKTWNVNVLNVEIHTPENCFMYIAKWWELSWKNDISSSEKWKVVVLKVTTNGTERWRNRFEILGGRYMPMTSLRLDMGYPINIAFHTNPIAYSDWTAAPSSYLVLSSFFTTLP